jgi:two-component system sensor histidine kinase AlgZ
MHPIFGDRRLLGLYLLGYIPIGVLLIIGLGQKGAWGTAVVFLLPLTVVYAFIGLSAYYLCLAFPLNGDYRPWRSIPAQMTAATTVGGLSVGIAWLWGVLLQSLNIGLRPDLYLRQIWLFFLVGALLFWLAIAVHYVLIASHASHRAERRALESELLAREAELKALRAQLDPHFLFNSLNSISSLTTGDPSSARKMCLLLADFLRDTLRLGATERISVREEVSVAQRYLAIEQVRLGSRLTATCAVSDKAQVACVPALILQPLVENAVTHGIAHLLDGGTISICADSDGTSLRILVSNPVDADRPRSKGSGVGLALVRQRLQSQLGTAGQLHAREEQGRFIAEVLIPYETVGPSGAS